MKLLLSITLLLLITSCADVVVRDENGKELKQERKVLEAEEALLKAHQERQERYREAHQKN